MRDKTTADAPSIEKEANLFIVVQMLLGKRRNLFLKLGNVFRVDSVFVSVATLLLDGVERLGVVVCVKSPRQNADSFGFLLVMALDVAQKAINKSVCVHFEGEN